MVVIIGSMIDDGYKNLFTSNRLELIRENTSIILERDGIFDIKDFNSLSYEFE